MNKILLNLICVLFIFPLSAQVKMKVERGDAVNKSKPIWNVYVDETNTKWVGNEEGLFRIHSINNGALQKMSSNEWSLLQQRSGNENLRVSLSELRKFIPNTAGINCAHLDKNKQELWIGTLEKGLFQFSLSPLKLIKNFTSSNSDLASNHINFIQIEPSGRMWIGTTNGIVWGKNGRWNLDEEYLNFVGVAYTDGKAILLSDEWIWEVNSKNKWKEIILSPQQYKGLLVDVDIDADGKMWLASEIITRTDFSTGKVEPFAAPEYYTSEFASTIMVDQDNSLWVGTRDKGLFLIQKEDVIAVSAVVEKPLSCDAASQDAALNVLVEGGSPPYQYQWSNGFSGASPTGLGAGKYTVTVTDKNGKSNSALVEVSDPVVKIAVKQIQAESAVGKSDAIAEVEINGGVPDYKIQWDNGEAKARATQLTGGLHTVKVSDDAGCSATAEINIEQNIADLAVKIIETNSLACNNSSNAALAVEVEGGKPPYTYEWSEAHLKGNEVQNLKAGLYKITIADVSGKRTETQYELQAPNPLNVEIEVKSAASSGAADGIAVAKVKGGKAPYTFKWESEETAATAKQLRAGKGTVEIQDANGCTSVGVFNIEEDIMDLNASIEIVSELKCADDANGELQVMVKGGKAPFTYQWNTGADTEKISKLSAGKYNVLITDASGQKREKEIEIKAPQPLSAKVNVLQVASTNQKDAKAKIKVQGGRAPYHIVWSNGSKGENIQNIGAGEYTVQVKDKNNCSVTESFTISEEILPLQAEIEIEEELLCADEETAKASVEVRGGKPPYTYLWSGQAGNQMTAKNLKAGTYSVEIKDALGTKVTENLVIKNPEKLTGSISLVKAADANEANGVAKVTVKGGKAPYAYAWSNGEKEARAAKLPAGMQQLEIKDANGCSLTLEVNVSEDVSPLVAELKIQQEVDCHGANSGAIIVEASGGKTPLQYDWNTGQKGTEIKQLRAGKYKVLVSDASGQKVEKEISLSEPEPLAIELKKKLASTEISKDGSATAKGLGGNGSYTFNWSTGATGKSIKKLSEGDYSVSVVDDKGCTNDLDFKIKVQQIPELTANTLRQGQTVKLEKLFFAADSSSIKEQSIPTLEELFEFLTENGSVAIEIGGHTNNIPPHEFCDALSTARAKAVADFLTAKGIDPRRVLYKGYGKRKPKHSNKTKEGRRKNQRVEIKVLSI